MSLIYKRVQEIMKGKGLKVSDFAQKLGEKEQRIRNIKNGKQRVPEDVMIKIVEIFNVNAAWLLTGKGSMYPQIKEKEQ